MLQTLFYLFTLFFIFCSVIVLFGFFANLVRAAETEACPPRRGFCVPDVKPPACEKPVCPKSFRITDE